VTLPAYRGDMVNDFDFTPQSREPDPQRLGAGLPREQRHPQPRAGLHHRRLRRPAPRPRLEQGLRRQRRQRRYERLAHDIDKAMKFMNACGADFEAMRTTEFFSAHEALLLDYERPLTRVDSRTGELYDTSGTSCGSGSAPATSTAPTSTSSPRVRNPVGVKVSANADTDDLLRIIDAGRPAARARPPDLHHPHGRGPHP
jgi:3-deoxy-7-phosphoheptulonate synthase